MSIKNELENMTATQLQNFCQQHNKIIKIKNGRIQQLTTPNNKN